VKKFSACNPNCSVPTITTITINPHMEVVQLQEPNQLAFTTTTQYKSTLVSNKKRTWILSLDLTPRPIFLQSTFIQRHSRQFL